MRSQLPLTSRVGTSSPSWAHLPFHAHIFPFMGTSSPSFCSHQSSPVNLNTYQQSESEAKAKAKAKPNMRIICSGPRHAQKTFESSSASFQPAPAKSLDYLCALKTLGHKNGAYALQISEKYLPAAAAGQMALLNSWPNILRFSITKLHKIQIRGFIWKAKPEPLKRSLTWYSSPGSFSFANSSYYNV